MYTRNSLKTIKKWEIAGLIFMIIVGPLLHFTYEWSGYNPVVGLFTPVNESVWEHLKLGFTSLLIFSIIEYFFLRNKTKNFFNAKISGILFQEMFIVVVFYTYTYFIGKSILLVDITSYIISCIICQFISYRILTGRNSKSYSRTVSVLLILLNILSFMAFTYYAPTAPVFKDPHNGAYGIRWNSDKK